MVKFIFSLLAILLIGFTGVGLVASDESQSCYVMEQADTSEDLDPILKMHFILFCTSPKLKAYYANSGHGKSLGYKGDRAKPVLIFNKFAFNTKITYYSPYEKSRD